MGELGSKPSMSWMVPCFWAAQRTRTRMPVYSSLSLLAASMWVMQLSVPSICTRPNANGTLRGWVGRGSATQVHDLSTPVGRSVTNSPVVGAPVSSYSCGGQSTRPSAVLTPSRIS
jgi:hypothetical protein